MEKCCSSFVRTKIPHELMPELCLAWGVSGPVGPGFLLQGEDNGATAGDHSTRLSVLQDLPPEFLYGRTTCMVWLQDSAALTASALQNQRAHGLLLSCQTRASWDLQEWVFQELTDLPLAFSLQETASLPTERCCAGEPSPVCDPIIIHRCEDDLLKYSLFGLTELPETATAYLALDFTEVEELCKGCSFL